MVRWTRKYPDLTADMIASFVLTKYAFFYDFLTDFPKIDYPVT